MDEVDIDDVDDLNELEARLYSQVHHEDPCSGIDEFGISPPVYEETPPVRQVTATSVINNKTIDRTQGRYWNEKLNIRNNSPAPPPPSAKPKPKQSSGNVGQVNKEKQTGIRELKENPVETIDKTFQPPVKNLSNMRVNPFASGNGPKTKGSTTLSANSRGKTTPAATAAANKTKGNLKGGLFARQQNKLANAIKYDGKKQKAKAAKAKMKKPLQDGTIEILSEDEDEVVEVPLPSPKIVSLDSSSDEENESMAIKDESFIKPEAVGAVKENSSRCTSPCSVISDDFIGQTDRTRLLDESGRADDEDLLMLQEDVDSLMETPEKLKTDDSFATPNKKTSNYVVTQNEFRALDVYESESDIQESIYSKGSKPAKPSVVVDLDHESSSDEVEEIVITQKTKRLRKRRSSSANKDVDTYLDSTDSENENGTESRKTLEVQLTKVPHIAFGEAIPNEITDETLLKQTSVINNSDNEFIANLNTLIQGASVPEPAVADESDEPDEDEEITARAIAESVLNKTKHRNSAVEPEIIVHEEEEEEDQQQQANNALPEDSLVELDQIFKKIDNMDDKKPVICDSEESNGSVELVPPLPVSSSTTGNKRTKLKMQRETGDPVYNVVYSENVKIVDGGGIGWNEEMRKFYNDSWHGERFNVKAICAQMKAGKTLWKIYTDDRFPKYRKYSHQKCMNCCEFGHIRSKCPRPKKLPICYMCGEKGHYEPRCPNTICLRCGNKTRMFTKSCNACNYQNRLICPICKVRGHSVNLCPDKWRRYHSTTKANQYPNSKVEYKNRKTCCVCGCRGHLPEHCRHAVHFSEYPIFVTEIRSHQKSYDDIAIRTIRSGIGYNLMYKPDEDVSFELAENKTKRQYYGRFLMAVGMGYLLTRKRRPSEKNEEVDSPAAKQQKVTTQLKEYVVNPFAKVALEKSPAKPLVLAPVENEAAIDVDEEEDEPVALTEETMACEAIEADEEDAYAIEPSTSKGKSSGEQQSIAEQANTFKTPESASPPANSGPSPSKKNSEGVDLVDSDSNYSFSEHFESNKEQPKTREMEPLPDFIPICDDEDMEEDEPEELVNAGISKKFVSLETDEEEENTPQLPDLPCDAKIYLTTFHSKFLLSPDGNKFLIENSKAADIQARLEWTSVGHILVIHGLRSNQDKFHIELLHKFRELSEKMNRNQLEKSQKVPRKTEVLIRFLRENLNQLLSSLGNPNELYKRLTYQEKQQTKTGWKSAEKTRRLLNMILIGQAGLRNGSIHLDQLLSNLRDLIDNTTDELVSNEVRDKIDSHWRLIFSSHRHDKYPELIEAYNNLPVKNRFQNINIDPRLLGKKMLDTSLTKAQKDKMDKPVVLSVVNIAPNAADKTNSPAKLVPNPLSVRTPNRQPKTPISTEKKRQKNANSNSPAVAAQKTPTNQQQNRPSTTTTQQQLANKVKAANVEWEAKCVDLLSEIDETSGVAGGGGKVRGPAKSNQNDSKKNSTFWSREALKYIDECMELGKSNAGFVEKLSRVQAKSQKGLLSYNDYRAIIKIHNGIKSKQ